MLEKITLCESESDDQQHELFAKKMLTMLSSDPDQFNTVIGGMFSEYKKELVKISDLLATLGQVPIIDK